MKEIGRNDPCPCGSGRKYKKCCIDKYPRDQCVYIGYSKPFQGVTFENGQVYVHLPSGEKAKAEAVLSRTQFTKRSGKDKVVSCIHNKATFEITTYLASSFDVVLVIDTNTKHINGDMVSISCILECYVQKIEKTQEIKIVCRRNGIIAFKNCLKNEAEKFAWTKLVDIVTSSPNYNENSRIGLITDHDLNSHSKYNARELPIYSDIYLPNNFTLIYAASDTGKENVLNMLIIECDKVASSILRQLEKKGSVTSGNLKITIDKIPNLNSFRNQP